MGVAGLLILVLAACSSGSADLGATGSPAAPAAPTASASIPLVAPSETASVGAPSDLGTASDPSIVGEAPPDVMAGLQVALLERAAAITGGDAVAFQDGLAAGDPAFLEDQGVWFTNLRQLPLQVYALSPDPATVVRTGPGAYWVNVSVTLQLQGYDTAPATTIDRYLFRSGARGERLRLASTTDPDWEARNGVLAPPWETGPLLVRTAPGVLGLFDPVSDADSGRLLSSVQAGIGAVSGVVPYPWSQTVVVVALSDDTFLRSLPDLPGSDPAKLDAVAYPVRSEVAASAAQPVTTVGTRLALHPRLLGRDGPGRERLLRHELTHVALGERDDHTPLWLSEGLAELVSVQADPVDRRRLQPPALAAARAGLTRLPEQTGFYDQDVAEHYGVSWWACEYAAATAGPEVLWALLEQLDASGVQSPGGVADVARQDAVLSALVGVNSRTLARKAGKLILATYEPPPVPAVVPPPTPVPGVVADTP